MSLLLAAVVVVLFAVILEGIGLPERAREVVRRARTSLDLLRDPSLDDAAKERGLQKHALRLFLLLAILTGGSALAILVPLGGVWLLDGIGVASLDGVLSVLERLDFLAGATVLGGAVYFLVSRSTGR